MQPETSAAENKSTLRRGSPVGWIIAFFFFPYGPFIYFAWLRAMAVLPAIFLAITSAVINFGMVSVMSKTNSEPWLQSWQLAALGCAMYCFGMLQYQIGYQKNLWNDRGRRIWRGTAWFFGVMLLLNVLVQIALFHLAPGIMHPK